MEYRKFSIFINSVQHGYTTEETSLTEGSTKYLRITDIVPYFVNKDKVPFCLISDKNREKYLTHENDLLIAVVGATTGSNLIVPKGFDNYVFSSNLVRFNYNQNELFPKYLKYVLKSQQYYGFVKNYIGGSAQPYLNPRNFGKFEIPYIKYVVQKRIASILSKYDDLIENNNKRIKILEQMAENLYKARFSYRKLKDSATYHRLGDIMQCSRGISYSSEEIDVEKGANLVNLKNIQPFGGFRRDGTKTYDGKYKEQQEVRQGDLIMGVTDMTQDRRTVGSVALVPKMSGISVISADLIKIISEIDNIFLYSMFRYGNISRHLAQFANGTNVLHLKPREILSIKIILPHYEIINEYVSVAKSLFEQIEMLCQINANLSKQRDMLLPRLMSGKLKVKV